MRVKGGFINLLKIQKPIMAEYLEVRKVKGHTYAKRHIVGKYYEWFGK